MPLLRAFPSGRNVCSSNKADVILVDSLIGHEAPNEVGIIVWFLRRDGCSPRPERTAQRVNDIHFHSSCACIADPIVWVGERPGFPADGTDTAAHFSTFKVSGCLREDRPMNHWGGPSAVAVAVPLAEGEEEEELLPVAP